MIEIDGSEGEGGGQILRTSLALSLITGEPFTLINIRAGRQKPGMMRQHVTSVEAACAISGAEASGLEVGSTSLVFRPGTVQPGTYHFSVGTAGATGLVLQTVLLPLLLADGPSSLDIEGGTHAMSAPCFDFLERSYLPQIASMGGRAELRLAQHGFYPRGGGRIICDIQPSELRPFELTERGALVSRHALVLNAALQHDIPARELKVLKAELDWPEDAIALRELPEERGPGNAIILAAEFEHVTEVVTAFAKLGTPAHRLAKQAASRIKGFENSSAAVGPFLADQLLLPAAVAGGGRFTTVSPTRHTATNAKVIERFLDVQINIAEEEGHYLIGLGS